ncbi:MAG TPA: hypothetical protein VKX28_33890 [Xanthobacteraceae bacterium]|jgi:hypothetical protein|nr:hypothetical protein [Xanthobacteraceae bacterium]
MTESSREIAARHVREGRRVVERQRRLIRRQQEHGHDTTLSKSLLMAFERTLDIFEADLAALAEKA